MPTHRKWTRRGARDAGWRVVFVPQAEAIHDESAIAIKGSPDYLRRFHSGRWRYILKHFPLDKIEQATFPAEADWLVRLDAGERLAANHAYRAALLSLPDIATTRQFNDSQAATAADWEAIRQGLQALRRAATIQ